MSKPVILTGLRANNDLHIGNYFGALLPMIDMVKNKSSEYQINVFVPDLHSFTTPIDHSSLQKQIKNNLMLFAASGLPLDNPNVHIYRQSYVPAHSELTWILDCFTYFGEMSRMTQFKDKSKDLLKTENNDSISTESGESIELKFRSPSNKNINLGLFNYPVLMAADILLYRAKYVPVGDDQSQHIEFARDIGERLNSKFNQELFVLPEPVKKQHEFFGKDRGLRIKNLQEPLKKMSKSDQSEKGIIFLGDSPDLAKQKIMSAATDSVNRIAYDPDNQPGISNLLQVYGLLTKQTAEEAAQEFEIQTNYGKFKLKVAEKVSEFLQDFQNKLSNVNKNQLESKLFESEKKMNEKANATLMNVQKAVGLR